MGWSQRNTNCLQISLAFKSRKKVQNLIYRLLRPIIQLNRKGVAAT